MYYAQGFALANWSAPLFLEKIIAWQLDPVVLEVYKEFEKYGSSPIPLAKDFDPQMYNQETKELLDKVFLKYGQFSAARLIDMTHEEAPWKMTKINKEISIKHLQDFFSRQVN